MQQQQKAKFYKNPLTNYSPQPVAREPTTSYTYSSNYSQQLIPPGPSKLPQQFVPMPPPANQAAIQQQFQQYQANSEFYFDKQPLPSNQNNLSATLNQSEILQIFPTPQGGVQQQQSQKKEYVQSYYPIQEEENQQTQTRQNQQILENFQIISTCKIKNMDLNSKTHNMIFIDNKAKEFRIQPFDENLKKEKLKNKQLVNSNLIIVQDKKIIIPDFEQIERLCQLHMKPIEKICTHDDCKQSNDILLCQDCARNHKGHNLYDISEVLFLIQKNEQSLEEVQNFIEILRCKTFSEFKFLKSNIIGQLEEVENKLTEGFNIFKQHLFKKKSFYEQAFKEIQFGGLSKMIEQVNQIYNQGVFQEVQQNSNDLQYNQLAQQLEHIKQSIKKFEYLVQQKPQDQIKIKINNIELQIQNQKIQNLNDLYYQIKIDALKSNLTTILDQELLLTSNNKVIRLKGNNQQINLKEQLDIQVISYLEI